MSRRLLILLIFALGAANSHAQEPQVVSLPPLSIAGSRVDWNVSYDANRGVYRYEYAVIAAATNKAPIDGLSIDVSGHVARPQDDPALQGNATPMVPLSVQPASTLPVKLTAPMSYGDMSGDLSVSGQAAFVPHHWSIRPGQTVRGLAIESRFPPGLRKATLSPSDEPWDAVVDQYRPAMRAGQWIEFSPNSSTDFDVKVDVVAPSDPVESDFYSGGGQQPAEVNKFLRYVSPKDSRIKVAAGTSEYVLIVFYGPAIVPSTFTATLAGSDVTSMFKPVPGSAQAVRIPLGPGTTKLQLSVEGVKADGHRATDTDTFTFLK